MHEREPIMIEDDAYWSHDLVLGEARVGDELSLVRGKVHVSDEAYRDQHTLFPLTHAQGERTYVQAWSYILEPTTTLTVDLIPSPTTASAIGEVTDAAWTGLQPRRLGTAQAWAYPADRLLVLWECVLDDWVRQDSPLTDPVLTTVWTGFERVLIRWFPGAERIATPSWEDLYERPAWQQFLAGQSYTPLTPGWFVKAVASEPPMAEDMR
jgi:hypothetical protein